MAFRPSQVVYVAPMNSDGVENAGASGFLLSHEGTLFLVTAWHVFSGKDFFTKALRGSYEESECVNVHMARLDLDGGAEASIVLRVRIRDAESKRPLWREYPSGRQDEDQSCVSVPLVDIAVIKVEPAPGFLLDRSQKAAFGLDEVALDTPPLGSQVCVPGFPFEFSPSKPGCIPTPVCMTGFVAAARFDRFPGAFLLDVTSLPGMSGAPVWTQTKDKKHWVLGLYSGAVHPSTMGRSQKRNSKRPDDPGIAIAWTGRTLGEIVLNGVQPPIPGGSWKEPA